MYLICSEYEDKSNVEFPLMNGNCFKTKLKGNLYKNNHSCNEGYGRRTNSQCLCKVGYVKGILEKERRERRNENNIYATRNNSVEYKYKVNF